jgi:hypothetical protein
MDKYSRLSSPEFKWKQNVRDRLNLSKKALVEHSNVMTKLSEGNVFIEEIFGGYNVLVQLSEMVRRGTNAVLESVRAYFPERDFFALCIEEDLQSARQAIRRLYKHGSHTDLFPDEIEFVQYLIRNDETCACGECSTSFRVECDPYCVRISRFCAPVPAPLDVIEEMLASSLFQLNTNDAAPLQAALQSALVDAESSDATVTIATLDEPSDTVTSPGVHIDNYGGIRIRATQQYMPFTQGMHMPHNNDNISGELIVDIPADTPLHQFINRENISLGRVSIAFNLGYLNSLMNEVNDMNYGENETDDEDYDDLQPVSVLMCTETYNQAVDIVKPVDGDRCPICIQNMQLSNSVDLNSMCVRVKCCKKVFHDACIRHFVCGVGPPKCPMCRVDLRDFSTTDSDDDDMPPIEEVPDAPIMESVITEIESIFRA